MMKGDLVISEDGSLIVVWDRDIIGGQEYEKNSRSMVQFEADVSFTRSMFLSTRIGSWQNQTRNSSASRDSSSDKKENKPYWFYVSAVMLYISKLRLRGKHEDA